MRRSRVVLICVVVLVAAACGGSDDGDGADGGGSDTPTTATTPTTVADGGDSTPDTTAAPDEGGGDAPAAPEVTEMGSFTVNDTEFAVTFLNRCIPFGGEGGRRDVTSPTKASPSGPQLPGPGA